MASPQLEQETLPETEDEEQVTAKRPRLAEDESRQTTSSSAQQVVDEPAQLSKLCSLVWDSAAIKIEAGQRLKLEVVVQVYVGGESRYKRILRESSDPELPYLVKTTPGYSYTATLSLIDKDGQKERVGSVDFHAVFSRKELTQLKDQMMQFVGTHQMNEITHLYRVKKPSYWAQIEAEEGQLMKKYEKDDTGHAASAINVNKMKGLFFAASLWDGFLPTRSPYGTQRMKISAVKLLDPSKVKAYFADFYCINTNGPHYAVVVIVERGTVNETFADKFLLPLDWKDNPILRADSSALSRDENEEDQVVEEGDGVPDIADGGSGRASTMSYFVHAAKKLWVEVYWTGEDIPLACRDGDWETVGTIGYGQSTPGGVGYNRDCYECNLQDVDF